MATTPAPNPPKLSDLASDVSSLEAQFKLDVTSLKAETVALLHKAFAAAELEGSQIAGALRAAVAQVKK